MVNIPCTKVVIPVRVCELETLQVGEEGARLLHKVREDTRKTRGARDGLGFPRHSVANSTRG